MPDSYSYYLEDDGEEIYYHFATSEAEYTVYFNPNEYIRRIEDYPFLLRNAYGFGFFQFPHNKDFIPKIDNKIKHTIEQIICDFFTSKNENAVILYHCDYTDSRQQKRSNKFNRWYADSTAKGLIKKHEIALEIGDNAENTSYTTHYIGYLCPYGNPHIELAHKEFEDFAANLVLDGK